MNRTAWSKGMACVAMIIGGLGVSVARGGTPEAAGTQTNPATAMVTLNDIYNVLNTRTTNVVKRTVTFSEPGAAAFFGSAPTGTMHTLNDIMTLATNRAPVQRTGQTLIIVTNADDAALRLGVAWPNPRFVAVGTSGEATNQIRDNLTGLIWARNANLASNAIAWATWPSMIGTCLWAQAFDVITNYAGPVNGTNGNLGYGYGGTNDWRLPNRRELDSLVNLGQVSQSSWLMTQGFANVRPGQYWSSSQCEYNRANKLVGWFVAMDTGADSYVNSPSVWSYVWPVRGGGQ